MHNAENRGIWYTTTDFNISSDDYAKATAILKKDYPEYDDFKTFHNMIEVIDNDASSKDECPYCRKMLDE